MRRREALVLVGGLIAVPLAARAQAPSVPLIGFLSSNTQGADDNIIRELRRGLADQGFVEGRTVEIVYQWNEGNYERLSDLAAGLVKRKVDLIIASGLPATTAAKSATSTIPIVFRFAVDPVAYGLARSLDRPGGNLTGVTMLFDPLTPKKLQLLQELIGRGQIGFLVNPRNPNVITHREHADMAARELNMQLTTLTAASEQEIEAAFASAREKSLAALLLGDDPLFFSKSALVVSAAARHRMPTMYYVRDFVSAGGLVSYGPNFDEMARLTGQYAGRILKGAQPADLPIQQPTRFELVINARTAKALGLVLPPALLSRADEVIE